MDERTMQEIDRLDRLNHEYENVIREVAGQLNDLLYEYRTIQTIPISRSIVFGIRRLLVNSLRHEKY